MTTMDALVKRYYGNCDNGYDAYGGCNSAWNDWARWVVLAAVIVGAIIIFFLFSCISARRRRKMGYAPYRGTGWAAPGGHWGGRHNAPPPETYASTPYYASNNYAAPPPTYQPNQGYYGGRGADVEMQPPANGYGNVYAPPAGAPPKR